MGHPAVFLRLQGCNLTCGGKKTVQSGVCESDASWRCDTIEVWTKGSGCSYQSICDDWQASGWMDMLRQGAHLVVTGGEPLLQGAELAEFLVYLEQNFSFKPFIELETNGTYVPPAALQPYISQYNVSFKTRNSGMPLERCFIDDAAQFFAVQPNACYKFVVANEADINDALSNFIEPLNLPKPKTFLMPAADSKQRLAELEPFLIEQCKHHCMPFSTRLHIAIWDQKTGV